MPTPDLLAYEEFVRRAESSPKDVVAWIRDILLTEADLDDPRDYVAEDLLVAIRRLAPPNEQLIFGNALLQLLEQVAVDASFATRGSLLIGVTYLLQEAQVHYVDGIRMRASLLRAFAALRDQEAHEDSLRVLACLADTGLLPDTRFWSNISRNCGDRGSRVAIQALSRIGLLVAIDWLKEHSPSEHDAPTLVEAAIDAYLRASPTLEPGARLQEALESLGAHTSLGALWHSECERRGFSLRDREQGDPVLPAFWEEVREVSGGLLHPGIFDLDSFLALKGSELKTLLLFTALRGARQESEIIHASDQAHGPNLPGLDAVGEAVALEAIDATERLQVVDWVIDEGDLPAMVRDLLARRSHEEELDSS